MCGIFFALSDGPSQPLEETRRLLEQRGPDSCKTHIVRKDVCVLDDASQSLTCHLTFVSTVLSLRGDHVHAQPLVDPTTQSVLCWNGEAWKIGSERVNGNDTELVFDLFLQAVKGGGDRKLTISNFRAAVAGISGPFSFVFYDAVNSRIFFSRDCLGRRSLLQGWGQDGSLKISSLCDGSHAENFKEVGFDGVYMIDLEAPRSSLTPFKDRYHIETLPWTPNSASESIGLMVSFSLNFP